MITDSIALLQHLFLGGAAPGCLAAADLNDDGLLGIDDAIAGLGYLFLGDSPPALPFPDCGLDPTPGDLDCGTTRC